MLVKTDILTLARRGQVMQGELELLNSRERTIPGGVQYAVQRYRRAPNWNTDDIGMLVYHYDQRPEEDADNYLELKFCLTGNTYCREKEGACHKCRSENTFCGSKVETLDVLSFRFDPVHLSQFARGKKNTDITYSILNFTHLTSFSKVLPMCSKTRMVLDSILSVSYEDTTLENIFVNAQTQILLLYSMECMMEDKLEAEAMTFTCKFLANETDRDKVARAREILLEQIGEPITIKELSRRVAMNECYLKKGFKEMYGTTIFDFYQSQRMEHARYLLYEKGISVTQVASMLGYSSISHFSTAFKKQTGLKPCELLLRNTNIPA